MKPNYFCFLGAMAIISFGPSECFAQSKTDTKLYKCYGVLTLVNSSTQDRDTVVKRARSEQDDLSVYKLQPMASYRSHFLVEFDSFESAESGIRALQKVPDILHSFSGSGRIDPKIELQMEIKGCSSENLVLGTAGGNSDSTGQHTGGGSLPGR